MSPAATPFSPLPAADFNSDVMDVVKEEAEEAGEGVAVCRGKHLTESRVVRTPHVNSEKTVSIHGELVDMACVSREQLEAWKAACLAKFPVHKRFKVISCDVPWCYQNTHTTSSCQNQPRYPVMPLDAVKALPVRQIADKTCVLFMWATNPLLPEALEVIRAWGFEYKTIFKVWSKRSANGKPIVGCGWWSRPSTELLLVATRGSGYTKWKTTCSEPQEFASVRPKGHSTKPPEILDQIRKYFKLPEGSSRLEMFARRESPGWDAWGLEVDGFFKEGPPEEA